MRKDESNPIFEVRELTKSYAGHDALLGCSLQVGTGEVVAIVGPSGSGKSTFLRCMNLLEVPDTGSIHFLGKPIFDADAPDAHRRRVIADARAAITDQVGMVFQSFNLFPNLTAEGNVSIALRRVKGMSKEMAQELARERLRDVGLESKSDVFPVQLSGGQKQRVAIARAVAMAPKVLLYDEPTSALDPELVGEVLATIRGLAASGMTKVIVTHEMSFARDIADHVIFMEDGRIVEYGTPEQIFTAPTQERTARFIKRFNDSHSTPRKESSHEH